MRVARLQNERCSTHFGKEVVSLSKKLLILSCSGRKQVSDGLLPALFRYNGPAYQILRKHFRDYHWPQDVSVGVLSAKHGLFGILKGIENYDQRMDVATARAKETECAEVLYKWAASHDSAYVSLGKDYLPAVKPALERLGIKHEVFQGGIGEKLSKIKSFLSASQSPRRLRVDIEGGTGRFTYFLPDWDDLLDPDFDFESDSFSAPRREERNDKHCSVLMQPKQMSDGILVSLAQQGSQKGPLRRLEGTEISSLSPKPLRSHYGLTDSQYLFGDCGAFSYLNEDIPAISVDQAVALYESYGFDFGASVDHIPAQKISREGKAIELSIAERLERVDLTRRNAELFIESARRRKVQFNPVGTIQALSPDQYAQSVHHYYEMGYRHLAIGGLVPKGDAEVKSIVAAVAKAADARTRRPWIHLFGIFRPGLQDFFRELKVDSFDSATYFRKAWLRSDQNYLGADGNWYAAIRVPMTKDGRTRNRLNEMEADIEQLEKEELEVLNFLCQYDRDEVGINEVLDAVLNYDSHLARSSETKSMETKYRRTLEERPWKKCVCKFCTSLGIHMLIFRGANRNKRRGAHNTLMLHDSLY